VRPLERIQSVPGVEFRYFMRLHFWILRAEVRSGWHTSGQARRRIQTLGWGFVRYPETAENKAIDILVSLGALQNDGNR
jgi:hypothetical protein